jgi:hypothetical protein
MNEEKCKGCQRSKTGCGFITELVQDKCPCGECLVKVNCSVECTERHIRYIAYVVWDFGEEK